MVSGRTTATTAAIDALKRARGLAGDEELVAEIDGLVAVTNRVGQCRKNTRPCGSFHAHCD
jgi:hypothetical protein